MAKFTSEEKIQAVKRYLNGKESVKTLLNLLVLIKSVFMNGLNNMNIMVKKLLKNAIQAIHLAV